MKNFSNTYIFIFSSVMVILVALLLSVAALQLKPFQEKNIRVEKMQNILASINIASTPQDAETLYKKYITSSMVINNKGENIPNVDAFTVDLKKELEKPGDQRELPLLESTLDDGSHAFIVPLQGKGLWGPIWGYISFYKDMNTVKGAYFDHQGETPGLGAEIKEPWFQKNFDHKTIFDSTKFVSIQVMKGGAQPGNPHEVDAVSGGTITSKGLQAMLDTCLVEYKNYFLKNRQSL